MHDDRQDKPVDSPLGKVGAVVAVFYVAALLLNAEGLHRNAQRMAYGRPRQVALALSAPVAAFARRMGVTKLRSGIERLMNETTKGVTE
jgi:predicted benzoate:H+ symporter BenE